MTDPHPTDRELVMWLDAEPDVRSGMPVARHLAECLLCRRLVARASPPIDSPRETSVLEFTLPATLNGDRPDLAKGQVWRVHWEGVTHLAMVWSYDQDWLRMIPVTMDVEFADDSTILVDADDIDRPVALWIGLEASLPYHVLDVHLFDLGYEFIDDARRLVRSGKPIDLVPLIVGDRIHSSVDERYEYRALLGDEFQVLAEAAWAPSGSGSQTLAELADAAKVNLGEVAEALGLPSTERLRLRRGNRPLSLSDAEHIAELLRVEPETVLATNPSLPPLLVLALSRPRWRGIVCERAEQAGIGEVEERRRDAYTVLGLAAREQGPASSEADWHDRLSHHFAS